MEFQTEAEVLHNSNIFLLGAISLSRLLLKLLIDWTVSYGSTQPDSGKHFLFLSFEPLKEEEYTAYGEKLISYLEGDTGKMGKAVLIASHNFPVALENASQAIKLSKL